MYKNFKLTDKERKQILESHMSHGYRQPLNELGDREIDLVRGIPDFKTKAGKPVGDYVSKRNASRQFQQDFQRDFADPNDEYVPHWEKDRPLPSGNRAEFEGGGYDTFLQGKDFNGNSKDDNRTPYERAWDKHKMYRDRLTDKIGQLERFRSKAVKRYNELKSKGEYFSELPELEKRIERYDLKLEPLNKLYDIHTANYKINQGENPNLLDNKFDFRLPK
jgi:hypothetical protein